MQRKTAQSYDWKKGETEYQNYEYCELANGDLLQIVSRKHEEPPRYNGYITRDGTVSVLVDAVYEEYRKLHYGAEDAKRYNDGNKPLVCADPVRMKLAAINAYLSKKTTVKLPSMKEVYEYGSL